MHYDITLLTDSRWVAPAQPDWYAQQILTEDGLVQSALEARGLSVQRVAWDDPSVQWEQTRFAMFRTTWDYFDKFPAFRKWLTTTAAATTFINDLELIQWNMDKHYLRDLEAGGMNVPPTYFIETGDTRSLKAVAAATGWHKLVLKPAVSGAGRHTYLFDATHTDHLEATYNALIASESMLLQLYQEQITTKGEVALMMMGGQYTHAVLKKAKTGDFRVQDDFGGTVHDYTPDAATIAFAEQALKACPQPPLHARVDIIWDNNNALAVSELELIEPELWFRKHPTAADILANAIIQQYFN
jgi:hypothetical protein